MNRKNELKAKKDSDILKDFVSFFNDGFRYDVIYEKLEVKYYLDKKTLSRIVVKQAKMQESFKIDQGGP